MSTIMVVDDEPAIVRALDVALRANGYRVLAAATGERAVSHAASHDIALIVLDLGLPDISGHEVIERIRAFNTAIPIIVLSAWGQPESKISALDLGADDYVEKPFNMPELLARIRVALRHAAASAGEPIPTDRITCGPFVLDTNRHQAWRGTDQIELTPTQYRLLELFATHPGRVLTRAAITRAVWGTEHATDDQNLRAFISQLRQRIEPDPRDPHYLLTDPGVGYRFEVPADE
jgi:two-component system KDP operon response regulator KdpE